MNVESNDCRLQVLLRDLQGESAVLRNQLHDQRAELALVRAQTEAALEECEHAMTLEDIDLITQFTALRQMVDRVAALRDGLETNPVNGFLRLLV